MKRIRIPHGFRELFGDETTPFALALICGFAGLATAATIWVTREEMLGLNVFSVVIVALLMIDIYGGVVANLSSGTNHYYRESGRRRALFIAIHVQPIVLALISGEALVPAAVVWGSTIAGAVGVGAVRSRDVQSIIGFAAAMCALLVAYFVASGYPSYIRITLMMYTVKVVYSFSVDHYAAHTRSAS